MKKACPACFSTGNFGTKCPNCATEVFETYNVEAPSKSKNSLRKWKENSGIKHYIDIYNKNPVKDWLSIHRNSRQGKWVTAIYTEVDLTPDKTELRRIRNFKRKNKHAPMSYTVTGTTATSGLNIAEINNPKNASIWLTITEKSLEGGCSRGLLYNGTTYCVVHGNEIVSTRTRQRPTSKMKRKLDAAVKKYLEETCN